MISNPSQGTSTNVGRYKPKTYKRRTGKTSDQDKRRNGTNAGQYKRRTKEFYLNFKI